MKYTDEQKEFIRSIALGKSNIELIDLFYKKFNIRLTKEQMKNFKANNKISSGLTGRFYKGQTSWNKGKKMKTIGRMAETQFKKGQLGYNHKPVGSERIDSKDGYLMIKVAEPNKWMFKQRYVWELHNGKIPKGYSIMFLDGNKMNVNIDNLTIVSKAQMAILNKNKMLTNDPEINKSVTLLADLIVKIGKKNKK